LLLRIGIVFAIPWLARSQSPEPRTLRLEGVKEPSRGISALPGTDRRWALIVGVDEYLDKQITPLAGAAADAHALADAMVQYAGFQPDHVILLASDLPPERQPTRGNILVRLSNIAGLVPKDGLLLFSFAGHGMERGGKAFLLPADAKVSNDIRVVQETAVAAESIRQWIADMGIKQVLVLLDACRNDPMAGRSNAPNLMAESYQKAFTFDVRNRDVEAFATFYATKVGERAFLYAEKNHGYFTWALLEGLGGAAANDAGEVTLGSLQRYVQDTVPGLVHMDLGADVDQRPFAEIGGYRAEELVIAKVAPRGAGNALPAGARDPRLAELEEWERIANSRDIGAFQAFRQAHPAGSLSTEATRRIEQISWDAAKATNSADGWQQFLTQFPGGAFAQQAADLLRGVQRLQVDRQAILDVLTRYAEVFSRKDLDQLRTLWPSLSGKDARKFQDFFTMARSIRMTLQPAGQIEIAGDRAVSECLRVLQFSDERGSQQPTRDRIIVKLRRTADSWAIDSVQ
jgi:hypothetical protein